MSKTSRTAVDAPAVDTVPLASVEATQATDMAELLAQQTYEPELAAVIADRYRIESLLGKGGMADVVLATDLVLDRQVAVKLLRDTTDTDGDLARFLAETSTLARLSHPGLVTVLDGGTTPAGRPYLVMELVDGPPLSASLDDVMDPVRAAEIGAQVAAALAYAHTQGVVHRDVKPGNVLVRGDGRVKLADFGIAKLLGDQSRHTRTGTVVGSVHYLAPEQVAFEEITPAVDVYGLGLMLLRCLTGEHAFDGPTIESALARLSADPEIPANLPAGWRDLLGAMTARDPEDRPSAAEVAGRLAWLSEARTTPRVLPPRPLAHEVAPVHQVQPHGARRRLAGAWSRLSLSPVAIGAAVLAVALFVAAAISGEPASSDDPAADAPTAQVDTGTDTGADPVQPVGLEPVADTVPAVDAGSAAGSQHQAKAKKNKAKPGKGKDKPGKGKPGKSKNKPGKGKPGKGKPGKSK